MTYEQSALYKNALAARDNDPDAKDRERLRVAYENAREIASDILGEIAKDFPNLTKHDISHVDALWQVASVIAGESYAINPLEGFVLGCAFLVHDAALSYFTIGGKDNLRAMKYWQDTHAEMTEETEMSDDEINNACDFITIRHYHAQKAAELISTAIKTSKGDLYIIENQSLRTHLGTIIGEIAASHHWTIDQVGDLNKQQNAPAGFRNDWHINEQKLACLLRCADAGHIDAGRTPDRLYHILNLHGVSANHWTAQNHLAMISADDNKPDRAIITSTYPFTEKEFEAWNVAYDAISVLNSEIKDSNNLLEKTSPSNVFTIKEVAGAKSKEELSTYIKTKGWRPCDANIHIEDVAGVIAKLGGEALYTHCNKFLVVARELVQNARDAIYARIEQEEKFNIENGSINIDISNVNKDTYIEVTDNGVGMSENVIKNIFLGFGNSLWRSTIVKSEFPGLKSSSFTPIGRYGIGFYSVFMIADEVIVETRQYKNGTNSTIQLKFPDGLTLTPILRIIDSNDTSISTKITVKINPQKYEWRNDLSILLRYDNYITSDVPIEGFLKLVFAGLDINVNYSENHKQSRCIHQNINNDDFDAKQWLRDISFADFRKNSLLDKYIEENYQRLERINIPGKIRGFAAINTLQMAESDELSVETIGGMANLEFITHKESKFYIGYLDYPATSSSRNHVSNDNSQFSLLRPWAQSQYDKLKNTMTPQQRIAMSYLLAKFGIDSSETCMISTMNVKDGSVKTQSLEELVLELKEKKRHIIFLLEKFFAAYCVNDNISYDSAMIPILLQKYDNSYEVFLPYNNREGHSFLVYYGKNTIFEYIHNEAEKQKVELKEENDTIMMHGGPYEEPREVYVKILSTE